MCTTNLLSISKGLVKELSFKIRGDDRGSLIALESSRDIPFEVKRIYYIFGTKEGIARGFHAHKTLKQVLIAVSGSVRIHCETSNNSQDIWLDSPSKGLYIDGLVWREMHDFSQGAFLVVLASELYTEADYIRNYDMFKQVATNDSSSF